MNFPPDDSEYAYRLLGIIDDSTFLMTRYENGLGSAVMIKFDE